MVNERRGNAAVVVCLSMVVLCASAALAVDVGYARMVKQELQNAADAAAHAGASKLDGTSSGVALARVEARRVAGENRAAGRPVDLDVNLWNDPAGDIVVGLWDADARTFTPAPLTGDANAVYVQARATGLGLFFAPVGVGRRRVDVGARSLMVRADAGAGAVDCFLPIGVPLCVLDRHGREGVGDLTLRMSPAGADNVGWVQVGSNPDASTLRDQVQRCDRQGVVEAGDGVELGNGTDASVLQTITDEIERSATSWEASWGAIPDQAENSAVRPLLYGRTLEGAVVVFDGGDTYCEGTGGSFTGSAPVAGFTWAAIFDVTQGANASVRLRLDATGEHRVGTRAGGADWGVTSTVPRMAAL
ncbi:MAG: pilus assembly protein TadG-related protein [Myxococcota bacterium]